MRITVFGANGKVGRLVVLEALKRKYEVTAFVHKTHQFKPHPYLQIVQGDIYNSGDVASALGNSEAVISTLGSWGTPKKDILACGMRNIIPVMKANKVERIISLTGGAANAPSDKLTAVDKLSHRMLELFAAQILHDGEEHIRLLDASGLNYTVLRSGIMNEQGNPEEYKLTNKRPPPWVTINRHAVAVSMVDLLKDTSHDHNAPFILRR